MNSTIVIAIGVVLVLVLVIVSMRGNSLSKAISKTRETKDISHVVSFIDGDKTSEKATQFNVAIKTLWDGYERELATDLIKALLERDDRAPISQQWIQQLLTVEPELARKQIGQEFLQAHFHEDIAQACAGCGGSCKSCK